MSGCNLPSLGFQYLSTAAQSDGLAHKQILGYEGIVRMMHLWMHGRGGL